MQLTPQASATIVCPKPTDAQIASQITNMRWQEQQASLQNTFARQQEQQRLGIAQRQIQIEHEHYLVEHLVQPFLLFCFILVVAVAVVKIAFRAIDAGIQKNKDDNASDVRRAQEILAQAASSD